MKIQQVLLAVLSLPIGWAAAAFDPTAPARIGPDTSPAARQPDLAWIRVGGSHSLAWYGGTTVRLGDLVEGGRVSAIHEDHIVISGKRGRRAVFLLDRSIRTQPLAQPRPAR